METSEKALELSNYPDFSEIIYLCNRYLICAIREFWTFQKSQMSLLVPMIFQLIFLTDYLNVKPFTPHAVWKSTPFNFNWTKLLPFSKIWPMAFNG